jgi:hypothetical protein
VASPLLGYNNNFRHKNRLFHVQTEDSGAKRPHIITHLFADGGRIVKSVKTTYGEYVGNPRMTEIVKEMMKQQHKAIIIALRDGQFDQLIDPKPAASSPAPDHSQASSAPFTKADADELSGVEPNDSAPASAPSERAPDTAREPHSDRVLTLDIDALERAATAAQTEDSLSMHASDLPPPPENLFREKSAASGYKSVVPLASAFGDTDKLVPRRATQTARTASLSAPDGSRTESSGAEPSALAHSERASEGRYGNARPAAIFTSKARLAPSKSLFGDGLISDKSLDEVILSYLAEDLDPDRK